MRSPSLALAACSARQTRSVGLALAACTTELPALAADGRTDELIELQVTPAGTFVPSDGRPMDVSAWRIDAAIATRVIDRFAALKTPRVIDYEHQTLRKEDNGQPAPAAAWMRELVWREGRGLFARVELTARARAAIAAREYRYFSPVFDYDIKTGEVLNIRMGALTNNPAIDGMDPIAVAAASFHLTPPEPHTMDLLKRLLSLLGLPEDSSEDDAVAALSSKMKNLSEMRDTVGVKKEDDDKKAIAACAALVASRADPAKYVPLATFEAVKNQVVALSASARSREVDELVGTAIASAKLLPAQEAWARSLGATDLDALKDYVAKTPAIAALTATQTQGRAPVATGGTNLNADELGVCTAMGLTPEAFAKARG